MEIKNTSKELIDSIKKRLDENESLEIQGEDYFYDSEENIFIDINNDVCRALGYSNPRDALVKHVDEDDKKVMSSLMSQNATLEIPNRGINVINESGLYSLILRSRKTRGPYETRMSQNATPLTN